MPWIYIQTEYGSRPCFTVGHYNPHGNFVPESDHTSADDAARRVHYLNGGDNARDEEEGD